MRLVGIAEPCIVGFAIGWGVAAGGNITTIYRDEDRSGEGRRQTHPARIYPRPRKIDGACSSRH
uniref:Uncharacterized protein n=1 Tax=Oryza glumipatula TaxID=40148 RepID=A0A0D9Z8J8_9ORYZ